MSAEDRSKSSVVLSQGSGLAGVGSLNAKEACLPHVHIFRLLWTGAQVCWACWSRSRLFQCESSPYLALTRAGQPPVWK